METPLMPRYYVRVIPEKGPPGLELYLTKRFREGHDGPFTTSFHNATRWATPQGPEKRLFIERDRLPNFYYGMLTFELVAE
jgi:hypothetical protein